MLENCVLGPREFEECLSFIIYTFSRNSFCLLNMTKVNNLSCLENLQPDNDETYLLLLSLYTDGEYSNYLFSRLRIFILLQIDKADQVLTD